MNYLNIQAALMLFILNVSIGGGVWIPFTLGKTVVLLTVSSFYVRFSTPT